MGKKGKNSNYITEKTLAVKAEREKAQRAKEKKKKFIAIGGSIGVFLAIAALIVGLGLAFDWFGSDFTVTHHANIEIEGYGTVHLELYGEEAYETVYNFVTLANEGFYDGLTFHRIIEGFMVQGGCPKGDGTGNADVYLTGEFEANGLENNIKHERGVISMARGDDYNSGTCQFFIVHQDSEHLDGNYAAFGRVIEGMDVIDAIVADAKPTDNNGSIAKDQQPVIKSITIHAAH